MLTVSLSSQQSSHGNWSTGHWANVFNVGFSHFGTKPAVFKHTLMNILGLLNDLCILGYLLMPPKLLYIYTQTLLQWLIELNVKILRSFIWWSWQNNLCFICLFCRYLPVYLKAKESLCLEEPDCSLNSVGFSSWGTAYSKV